MSEEATPEAAEISAKDAQIPLKKRGNWPLVLVMTFGLFFILSMVIYLYGRPWLEYQWSRLEILESQTAELEKVADEAKVIALATSGADQEARELLIAELELWQKELTEIKAAQQSWPKESYRQLIQRIGRLEVQLDRVLGADRRAWLGREAAFLARLASQRLLAARDIDAAIALLQQSDDLLRDADEPQYEAVRLSIATDMATLRRIPRVDQVGLYARLSALIGQITQLKVSYLGRTEQVLSNSQSASQKWFDEVPGDWQAALARFSDYLVFRRRDPAVKEFITPEWEALARQNLRMLIEQAQIAMLSANQTLYEKALYRALSFVVLFKDRNSEQVAIIVADIEELLSENIAPNLPSITKTRSALEAALKRVDPEVNLE